VGLLLIFLAMLALAYIRTTMKKKGRGAVAWSWFRQAPVRT
jgi:hypothetical protein